MGKKRNVYFSDESIWEALEKIAKQEDRSINYILQRAAKREIEFLKEREDDKCENISHGNWRSM